MAGLRDASMMRRKRLIVGIFSRHVSERGHERGRLLCALAHMPQGYATCSAKKPKVLGFASTAEPESTLPRASQVNP